MKPLEGLNWSAPVEQRIHNGYKYVSAILVDRDPREVGESKTMFWIDGKGNRAQERLAALLRVASERDRLVEALRNLIEPARAGAGFMTPDNGEVNDAEELLREIGEA